MMPKLKLYQFQGIRMEQLCPVCHGDPKNSPDKINQKSHLYNGECSGCKGWGKVLTPEGREFINFCGEYLGREFRFCQC